MSTSASESSSSVLPEMASAALALNAAAATRLAWRTDFVPAMAWMVASGVLAVRCGGGGMEADGIGVAMPVTAAWSTRSMMSSALSRSLTSNVRLKSAALLWCGSGW